MIYVGQLVQYRYKPSSEPVAALVTVDKGDGWVSLQLFTEIPRWVPMVEYAEHCRPAAPAPEAPPSASAPDLYGIWP